MLMSVLRVHIPAEAMMPVLTAKGHTPVTVSLGSSGAHKKRSVEVIP